MYTVFASFLVTRTFTSEFNTPIETEKDQTTKNIARCVRQELRRIGTLDSGVDAFLIAFARTFRLARDWFARGRRVGVLAARTRWTRFEFAFVRCIARHSGACWKKVLSMSLLLLLDDVYHPNKFEYLWHNHIRIEHKLYGFF